MTFKQVKTLMEVKNWGSITKFKKQNKTIFKKRDTNPVCSFKRVILKR